MRCAGMPDRSVERCRVCVAATELWEDEVHVVVTKVWVWEDDVYVVLCCVKRVCPVLCCVAGVWEDDVVASPSPAG